MKGKVYQSCVGWYERALRREGGNVLKEGLKFEADGRKEEVDRRAHGREKWRKKGRKLA